jgi:hypothetical protein
LAKWQERLEKASDGGFDKQLASTLLQQRETLLLAEQASQREASERLLKELRTLYEGKLSEKDVEVLRLREALSEKSS